MKNDMKSEARMKMLKKLRKEMKGDKHEKNGMKDKLKGMEKVTVASDSPEGLMKGMDVAKKIMKKRLEGEDFACGGKKEYSEGGMKKDEDDLSGEKGMLTDADLKRYKKKK
jgi:hypothetical protein